MDVLGIIIDGFKKVFKCDNALLKHVSIFALTGLLALNSSNMKTLTNFASTASDVSGVLWGGLLALAISIYLCGYSLKFMHNAFNQEDFNILPEIDANPFSVFLGALPLVLLWIVYVVLICFIGIIPFLGWAVILIFLPVISVFLQFVYIAYSKHYMANGLFNLFIPFTFAKHSWFDMLLFGLFFLPVYICAFLPVVILAIILIFTAPTNSTLASGAGSILGGYIGFVVQLVWVYCMVQVYKEKIEPNMDLD